MGAFPKVKVKGTKNPWWIKMVYHDPENSLDMKIKIHPLMKVWVFIKLFVKNVFREFRG